MAAHRFFMIRKQREKEMKQNNIKMAKKMKDKSGWRETGQIALAMGEEGTGGNVGEITIRQQDDDQVKVAGKGSLGLGKEEGTGSSRKKKKSGKDHHNNRSSMQYQHQRQWVTGNQHQQEGAQNVSTLVREDSCTDVFIEACALQQASETKQVAQGCNEAICGKAMLEAVGGAFFRPLGCGQVALGYGVNHHSIAALNDPMDLFSFDAASFLHSWDATVEPSRLYHDQGYMESAASLESVLVSQPLNVLPHVRSVIEDLWSLQREDLTIQQLALPTLCDDARHTSSRLLPRKRMIDVVSPSPVNLFASPASNEGFFLHDDLTRHDAMQTIVPPQEVANQKMLDGSNKKLKIQFEAVQSYHEFTNTLNGSSLNDCGFDNCYNGVPQDAESQTEEPLHPEQANNETIGVVISGLVSSGYQDSACDIRNVPDGDGPDHGAALGLYGSPYSSSLFDNDVFYYSEILAEEADENHLSSYQCELRKHLELFEADPMDVRGSNTPGRLGRVKLGQLGLRCRYCAQMDCAERPKGAANYSSAVNGIYQIAQNMTKAHLCEKCTEIPQEVRNRLVRLRADCSRSSSRNCKRYWVDCIQKRGVYEIQVTGSGRLMRNASEAVSTVSTEAPSKAVV